MANSDAQGPIEREGLQVPRWRFVQMLIVDVDGLAATTAALLSDGFTIVGETEYPEYRNKPRDSPFMTIVGAKIVYDGTQDDDIENDARGRVVAIQATVFGIVGERGSGISEWDD